MGKIGEIGNAVTSRATGGGKLCFGPGEVGSQAADPDGRNRFGICEKDGNVIRVEKEKGHMEGKKGKTGETYPEEIESTKYIILT